MGQEEIKQIDEWSFQLVFANIPTSYLFLMERKEFLGPQSIKLESIYQVL